MLAGGLIAYWDYVRSFIWHCAHGSKLQLRGHSVNLPLTWSPGKAELLTRTVIRQAKPFGREGEEIVIDPTSPETVPATDEELSGTLEKTVSAMNDSLAAQGQAIAVWHHGSASIRARSHTFRCTRSELNLFGKPSQVNVLCQAPGIPLDISYSGPPLGEADAIKVLQTFDSTE